MKTLNSLTLHDILSSGFNVTVKYKNYFIVYHSGYVTIYNKKKEYQNCYILNVMNYSLTEWKKIIKSSVNEK